jgi:hypothetical protein
VSIDFFARAISTAPAHSPRSYRFAFGRSDVLDRQSTPMRAAAAQSNKALSAILTDCHQLVRVSLLSSSFGTCTAAGGFRIELLTLGGHLRHQFLIFPFLVLALISIASVVIRNVRPRLIIILLAAMIGANAIAGYRRFQIVRTPLFSSELQKFRAIMRPDALLYLDEFSTIAFFSHYHAWHWHLAASDAIHTLYYQVTKDGRTIQIIRARGQWNLKPFDETLYADLKRSMTLHGARSAALFGLSTLPAGMPADEVRTRVARAAAAQHLLVDKIVVDGPNLYACLLVDPLADIGRPAA